MHAQGEEVELQLSYMRSTWYLFWEPQSPHHLARPPVQRAAVVAPRVTNGRSHAKNACAASNPDEDTLCEEGSLKTVALSAPKQ